MSHPCAVASYDAEGVGAAIDWCCEHMEDGDTLTVWTSLESNLQNCSELEQLVSRHSNVEHVTGRGGGFIRGNGPVLMAWPDMADIGKLVHYGGHRIRALCVIAWNEDEIGPWVTAVRPSILGDGSAWEELTPELGMLLLEAARQAALATASPRPVCVTGMDSDFVKYAEMDAPCWLEAEPMAEPGRVRVGAHQHNREIFSAVVTLTAPPAHPSRTA
ncbi:AfsA-related hotdog domain-containing protein [Streptomyces sp. JJ66]|uniref:AfsA-related hotdog domain-containing protein n=1 Tax=Streptomyces sp. JJ66 TaxID=2803843 RepID=UPI0027E229B9|nr:AfsA-related hotdog domain-containing protein [Streptomyces sp. JJ66]